MKTLTVAPYHDVAVPAPRPETRPAPSGGHLLNGGLVGHKGGPGRPTEAFKTWCAEAAFSDAVRNRIQTELLTGDPFPVQLWRELVERAFGKVQQAVTEDRTLTIKITQETV